jgi:hypothetical protein
MTSLSRFFSKPKLEIGAEMISPQLDIIGKGVTRKWLKVRVTNPGRAIATKCRADLDVIPAKGLKYPSDSKRLMWDDDTEEKNIRIKDSKGEILKVVFRDSDFPIGYIHAMVSTKEAETLPKIRAQDGFEFGAFDVRISVASDDAKASAQKMFRIYTGNDMNDFSIQAI